MAHRRLIANKTVAVIVVASVFWLLLMFLIGFLPSRGYEYHRDYAEDEAVKSQSSLTEINQISALLAGSSTLPNYQPSYLPTPKAVKAIYLTSWVAGSKKLRDNLIKLIEQSEINAVVIDVKDYTGRIAFPVTDPYLQKIGASEKRITDIRELIADLHQRQIYVIARISVFQDVYLSEARPELAVKRASDGRLWRDRKGVSWLDVSSREVWDYTVAVANEARAVGFDELNFDYIRFPSDGNMKDISYPFYHPDRQSKADALAEFFAYLHQALAKTGAPLSADLFGMVCTNQDDLGIGQVLEKAEPYFDFIAPMVYPSHYPAGYLNFSNPATKPYEVISHNLAIAGERLQLASSTKHKLRPWLQDFNLGADYTADMIRAQHQAVYDQGLTSWMMWSPANRYTTSAYD